MLNDFSILHPPFACHLDTQILRAEKPPMILKARFWADITEPRGGDVNDLMRWKSYRVDT